MVKAQLNLTVEEKLKLKIEEHVKSNRSYRSISHFVEGTIIEHFERLEKDKK